MSETWLSKGLLSDHFRAHNHALPRFAAKDFAFQHPYCKLDLQSNPRSHARRDAHGVDVDALDACGLRVFHGLQDDIKILFELCRAEGELAEDGVDDALLVHLEFDATFGG